MRHKIVLGMMTLVFALAGMSCGSSGSSTPSSTTATLGMTITQSNSQVLTSLSKEAGGAPLSKAVDLTAYSISCKDGAGIEYTSTISAAGAASVPDIPTGTPVVCYLLDSTGAPVTPLTVSDAANVLGGQYDAPKLSANATNTVVFNPLANGAVVTPDANTSVSATGTAVDFSGSYAMTCVGVFNEVTGAENAAHTATYCAQFVAQENTAVYLHRISATQGGNTVYGMGAWRSQAAHQLCGSTEAIDNLPSGMTLDDSTQSAAFSWDSNFSGFSSSSTTDQIADMIANFGNNASRLSQTYAAYSADPAGHCAWMAFADPAISAAQQKAMCASMYYWEVIEAYLNSNPSSYCVPSLNVAWTTTNNAPSVALSAKAGLASTAGALNRFDFMPVQFITDASGNPVGRMSSKEFWTFSSYNQSDQTSVDCIKTVGMLVQFQIPATAPVASDQVTTSFFVDSSVASQDGNAANTTLCQAAAGLGGEMAPNGYYLRVTMTKQ